MFDAMQGTTWMVVLSTLGAAGCAIEAPSGEISLRSCSEGCEVDRPLGVGGTLYAMLYQDGELASDARLVSTDDSVLAVEVDDRVGIRVTGRGPGTAALWMIDASGKRVDEVELAVAPVTALRLVPRGEVSGPYLDDTSDGTYRVPASAAFSLGLVPEVSGARSRGVHFYEVALNGEPYDCETDGITYCRGPVYYDQLAFTLVPGDHALTLRALDGGRDFSFQLVAR